ncbi:Aldehyde dehydrogenase family protein (plasmid) [Sulfitobacter sp. THAF37]|nr:Aldehyde dehydrogenase family protein [Sulfitobacter sp. THAF37]
MKYQDILDACGLTAADTTGGTLAVTTPVDGSEIGQVPMHTVADAKAAIARGVDAFAAWRKVPAPRRGELVRLLGEGLCQVVSQRLDHKLMRQHQATISRT